MPIQEQERQDDECNSVFPELERTQQTVAGCIPYSAHNQFCPEADSTPHSEIRNTFSHPIFKMLVNAIVYVTYLSLYLGQNAVYWICSHAYAPILQQFKVFPLHFLDRMWKG